MIDVQFLKAGTALSNYTSVLTMLLRLRQGCLIASDSRAILTGVPLSACCHPALVTASLDQDKDAIDISTAPKSDEQDADDLAALLGGIGLEGRKQAKCDMCFSP